MGCSDSYSFGFYSDNDHQELNCFGYLNDGYPGCGSCPDCCYQEDYNEEKIRLRQEEGEKWYREHPFHYVCNWEAEGGNRGSFDLRAKSLEAAREIAMRSLFQWTSLLIFKRR